MLFDRYVAFSAYIERLYKDVQKIKAHRMNRFGLKGTDVTVMIMAARHPEGATVTELANECQVDKAVVSRATHFLMEQGYMEALDKTERSYRKKLKLTEKGCETAIAVSELAAQAVSAVSDEIPTEEIDALYRTLEKIAQNISRLTGANNVGEEST
jgi:DNA-binding MarR family transcriptional regulator